MSDETEIRATALNIANHTFRDGGTPEQVVAAATIYYSFLSGVDKPPEKEVAPPKAGRPKKAAPEPSAPAPSTPTAAAEAAPKADTAASASPTEKPATTDEVRAVLIAIQTRHGKPRAQALLDKYAGAGGVISKIPEGDRAKLIAEGQAIVS